MGRHGCSRITLNIQHFPLVPHQNRAESHAAGFFTYRTQVGNSSEKLEDTLAQASLWQLWIVAYHSIISPDKMDTTGFQEAIFNVNCDFGDHLLKTSGVHRALVRSSGLGIRRKVWSTTSADMFPWHDSVHVPDGTHEFKLVIVRRWSVESTLYAPTSHNQGDTSQ